MSVMIGIDPHKGSHTAVVINGDEVVIDQIRVRASANQLGELQRWAVGYDDRCWAVESARGLAYLISLQLEPATAPTRRSPKPCLLEATRVALSTAGRFS